ncbi:MAG TPA: beta-ketoacyl synthase N-terminal-like domain-containing protein [Candidatus Limnocylindrales bacterium]|nr:beta-ketoacyl synthase N-terminal-like domain-containing protein [Candidatus Limnocylindrales bacterium]
MSAPAAITGMAATTAYGRGTAALLAGVLSGKPAFGPLTRFDVSACRTTVAATLAGSPSLHDELRDAITAACDEAGLSERERRSVPLRLAIHGDHRTGLTAAAFARTVADAAGVCADSSVRTYTSACVAASTAVADAAAGIALGDVTTVVVAAGYLVESDQFAVFDAGRALARDGEVRPFSLGRKGIVMGDGVAAVVLTGTPRDAPALARVEGWGRAGEAYHVCQPHPEGVGLGQAIGAALRRAGLTPAEIGYVNAHGSGSVLSDAAEANALHRALGEAASRVPLSSTKSLHGQALEASPLVELVTTVLALREGYLPINAGFLEPDPQCRVRPILDQPLAARAEHALSLNSAFGGACTALIVSPA